MNGKNTLENKSKFIYSEKEAVQEAKRCLNCQNKPCVMGCPAKNDIPGFIENIAKKNFYIAKKIISNTNSLPGICGMVCPQEIQCKKNCTKGIKGKAIEIGKLESFAAYHSSKKDEKNLSDKDNDYREFSKNKKVLIIGSGPAGLSCAKELAKNGVSISIYEKKKKNGGMLTYLIPKYRLPKELVEYEVNYLKKLGVKFYNEITVGKTISFEKIKKIYNFDAYFIGTGAWLPKKLDIECENLCGVFSGMEFLKKVNLDEFSHETFDKKKVIVIGAGNVSIDAARSAKRLGSDVTLYYRRSRPEMSAWPEEIRHAEREGVKFKFNMLIKNITKSDSGSIQAIFQNLKKDEDINTSDVLDCSKFRFETQVKTDFLIYAIGLTCGGGLNETFKDLKTDELGRIITEEETGKTSIQNIFAGGDAVFGPKTVVSAVVSGKVAAGAILEYLKQK